MLVLRVTDFPTGRPGIDAHPFMPE